MSQRAKGTSEWPIGNIVREIVLPFELSINDGASEQPVTIWNDYAVLNKLLLSLFVNFIRINWISWTEYDAHSIPFQIYWFMLWRVWSIPTNHLPSSPYWYSFNFYKDTSCACTYVRAREHSYGYSFFPVSNYWQWQHRRAPAPQYSGRMEQFTYVNNICNTSSDHLICSTTFLCSSAIRIAPFIIKCIRIWYILVLVWHYEWKRFPFVRFGRNCDISGMAIALSSKRRDKCLPGCCSLAMMRVLACGCVSYPHYWYACTLCTAIQRLTICEYAQIVKCGAMHVGSFDTPHIHC